MPRPSPHQNAAVEASRSAHTATASQTSLTEQRALTTTQPEYVNYDLTALHPAARLYKPAGHDTARNNFTGPSKQRRELEAQAIADQRLRTDLQRLSAAERT